MKRHTVKEALETIEHAERAIVSSWSYDQGKNLMDALSDLGALRSLIEDDEPETSPEPANDDAPPSPEQIRDMASALASSRPGGAS